MLANSPTTREPLETLSEADEAKEMGEMFPMISVDARGLDSEGGSGAKPMSLAQELGVSDSPPESPRPESPLREKRADNNVMSSSNVLASGPERRVYPAASMKDKGKGKANPPIPTGTHTSRMIKTVEKENTTWKKIAGNATAVRPRESSSKGTSVAGPSAIVKPAKPASGKAASSMPASKARLMAKLPGPGTMTGPRRVPIDSAEAPPVGRGRRS